jgi:choline dehydrogenase-like flavoprotein
MSSLTANNADVIVVGSGLSGSWVAKELTSGGMKVALIDAGSLLQESAFSTDAVQTGPFNPRYHLFRLRLLLKGDKERALNKFSDAKTYRLFLDRRRDPYVTPLGRDFTWSRVRAVGGRGHLWGRVMLRPTDNQFSIPGFEWPVRYEELAPYYSEIEHLLEMGGAESRNSEVPDGEYVHKRSLHPIEELFCEAVVRRWPQRRAVVNHVAGYEPGPLSPMLKAALATGRLHLLPNKVVSALTTDGTAGAITGVITVCTRSEAVESFRSRYVVLAASAFESVRILLNSRSERFPNGVGNNNGLVGTRILEHVTPSVFAQLPASLHDKNPTYGHNPFKLNAEPHGFYMPPFTHLENHKTEYHFGYGVQGTISSDSGLFYLGAFGATIPSDTNRLKINESKKDRFGVPVASIDFSWTAEDLSMWEDSSRVLAEMIKVFEHDSGIKLEYPVTSRVYKILTDSGVPVPGSNHECGGARMGTDAASSVVDLYNRVWDAPNVLVCDAACFPSIPHQNPTLTTMALAVRAARKLVADA